MALPQGREVVTQAFDRVWAAASRPAELVSHGATGGPARIALSFDDGPSAANTAAVLDLLDENESRGTFFVVGSRIPGHEELLCRVLDGGHELANHTYSHLHTVRLPRVALAEEVRKANDAIVDAVAGRDMRVALVRPPFGKDRRRLVGVARELGLLVAVWSIDSGDALGYRADEITKAVLARAAPGSIVLMHDGGLRRDSTLAALAKLIPQLRDRGFELVTISELLGLQTT